VFIKNNSYLSRRIIIKLEKEKIAMKTPKNIGTRSNNTFLENLNDRNSEADSKISSYLPLIIAIVPALTPGTKLAIPINRPKNKFFIIFI
jgi:hypothetical protein